MGRRTAARPAVTPAARSWSAAAASPGSRRPCEAAGLGAAGDAGRAAARSWAARPSASPTPPAGREVDNGQHVFLGCCPAYIGAAAAARARCGDTTLQRAPRRAGARPRGARRGACAPRALPAPLHLGGLLRGLPPPVARARRPPPCAALAALGGAAARGARSASTSVTLRRLAARATARAEGAIARFWDLIVLPTCNDRSERVSAALAAFVFQRGLPADRPAGRRSAGRASGSRALVDPAARDVPRGPRRDGS